MSMLDITGLMPDSRCYAHSQNITIVKASLKHLPAA